MLKKLKHMNLEKKLTFGYFIVIGMMILSGIISIVSVAVLYGNLHSYVNGSQRADTAVKNCRIDINIAARNIREMAMNTDTSTYSTYKKTVEEKLLEVDTELKALKSTKVVDEELYKQYVNALTDWGTIGDAIMKQIESGNREAAEQKILKECAPALNNVVELSNQIDLLTDEKKEKAIMKSTIVMIIAIVSIVVFIIIASVIASKIAKKIIASIMNPLRQIESVAHELENGNLHSKLDYHSEDEMGNLASSLRKAIETLSAYVDDIARAMKEFSSGNFVVEPEVEWKGDFVGILDSFREFMGSMAETIKGIQAVADQVTSGAEQVAQSSMDLAEGASEQAGITQELSATLTSISERVLQNAENAKKISKEVENVGDEMINSNGKMKEMVESMREINVSSQEISKIIATINDIASQTNLLALNASIEAARAGDAGKGFAVVADQVSVLAAQSADAAKESTILIETSMKAVEKGMVIADETAQQLEQVVDGSKSITKKVNDVAEALENQTESISQLNDGVDHINDVVQTNSATSEQCAASSQEMTGQAVSLRDLISRFKVVK